MSMIFGHIDFKVQAFGDGLQMPHIFNLLLCLKENVSNEMIENEEPVLSGWLVGFPYDCDRNESAAMIFRLVMSL